MKAFRFLILSVAAMASIAANGQKESSPAALGDPAVAQEIRAWIDHWRKAVSAKDVDRVMELYTEDVVAYATGLQMISGMLKHGQKSGMWVRFTSLYRKVNGKWLDFHDHVSVPVEIESGKAMLDLKP
jgi:ketosteroid isomerase-like protein